MSAEVKVIDHGLRPIMEALAELSQLTLTIGFQGATGAAIHPSADVPVATIALYAEFGTINAPARSFLRSTMFERRKDIARLYAVELGKVVGLKQKPVEALSNVGAGVVEMVREKINRARTWAVRNAESTIERKGHAQPLIGGDAEKALVGGKMRDSVTWAVRKAGAIVAEGT